MAIAVPTDVVDGRDDKDAKFTVGDFVWIGAQQYRYVKFDNGAAVAGLADGVVHFKTFSQTNGPVDMTCTVTSDVTDAITPLGSIAGVLQNAPTDLYHTFIQVKGVRAKAKVVSTILAGDLLVAGTVDLEFAEQTSTYTVDEVAYGVGLETAASGKAKAQLWIPV